jgi:hypothetical protein
MGIVAHKTYHVETFVESSHVLSARTMWCMATVDPRARIVEGLILQLGKSVRWLAGEIGASHPSVGKWLTGDATPRRSKVWDEMLEALRQEEERQANQGELRIFSPTRLTLRILVSTTDVSDEKAMSEDAGEGEVKVSLPDNGRKHWARNVKTNALYPHAELGQTLIFDDREAESTNAVEAMVNGRAVHRFLQISKGRYILRSLDPADDDIEVSKDAIRGVVAFRQWKEPGGITLTADYEYGMRHRF